MKRTFLTLTVVLVFSVAMMAQSSSYPAGGSTTGSTDQVGTTSQSTPNTNASTDKSKDREGKKVTLKGCLSKEGDMFMVSDKDHPAGVHLDTTEDLTAHVGHKVQVKGTWEAASAATSSMTTSPSTTATTGTESSTGSAASGTSGTMAAGATTGTSPAASGSTTATTGATNPNSTSTEHATGATAQTPSTAASAGTTGGTAGTTTTASAGTATETNPSTMPQSGTTTGTVSGSTSTTSGSMTSGTTTESSSMAVKVDEVKHLSDKCEMNKNQNPTSSNPQ
ncbi:MAG TPA: hypothetical protein VLA96_00610 [Terriglobales bacterium]|nr:hypothetical protein [Terriglobales bacterium]